MTNQIFKTVKNVVQHWYIPLIVGLLFVALAIYTFTMPLESYVALSFIFSYSILFSGLAEIFFSISNKKEMDNWGWTLIFGIINVMIGLLLLSVPEISIATLATYMGFLVLFRSVGAISFALDLKNYKDSGWGALLFLGILGILFSFLLLTNSLLAGETVVMWTAIALLCIGLFSIYLGLVLKKLKP